MTVGELIKELMRLDVHLPVYVHTASGYGTLECSVLIHEKENKKDVLIIR